MLAVQRQPPRFLGRLALNDRELHARSRLRQVRCRTGHNTLELLGLSHWILRTRAAAEQLIEAELLVAQREDDSALQ